MTRTRSWAVAAVAMLGAIGLTAACAPQAPGGGVASADWAFKGTSVRVNDSQDSIGVCWPAILCQDEPYLLNIGFRVKIGVANSAQAFVINPRTSAPENVSEGQTVNVLGTAAESKTTFAGVKPMDVLDLANSNNKLEIVGTYVWGSEEDQVGNGLGADAVADLLEDGLNATLAQQNLSNLDAGFIIDLVLDNIGGALGIVAQNIPLFGLGDDIMGGGMYIGIAARGTLGSAIDALLGSTTFPNIEIPVVDLPPDIDGGALYTMTGTKNFTQTFVGGGGSHTWNMQSGPA
ncbi:MAG: hypothetical protein ACYC2O_11300 [Microthrixaceae bacterium]